MGSYKKPRKSSLIQEFGQIPSLKVASRGQDHKLQAENSLVKTWNCHKKLQGA